MNIVKLQVPMSEDVKDALELKSKALGFDSVQAYIRFWAKAEADGRTVNFNESLSARELALLSENSLSKTWNDAREDEAWKSL